MRAGPCRWGNIHRKRPGGCRAGGRRGWGASGARGLAPGRRTEDYGTRQADRDLDAQPEAGGGGGSRRRRLHRLRADISDVREVVAAGADCVAVISAVLAASDPGNAMSELVKEIEGKV